MTFPLEDCSEFGNFVITLIITHNLFSKLSKFKLGYDFCTKTMFCSLLSPVVCRGGSCLTYVICVCLRIVVSSIYCAMLLLCSFFCVLCTLCFQFLWIGYFCITLRYSLTFTDKQLQMYYYCNQFLFSMCMHLYYLSYTNYNTFNKSAMLCLFLKEFKII